MSMAYAQGTFTHPTAGGDPRRCENAPISALDSTHPLSPTKAELGTWLDSVDEFGSSRALLHRGRLASAVRPRLFPGRPTGRPEIASQADPTPALDAAAIDKLTRILSAGLPAK
jgi:hypothetical protein